MSRNCKPLRIENKAAASAPGSSTHERLPNNARRSCSVLLQHVIKVRQKEGEAAGPGGNSTPYQNDNAISPYCSTQGGGGGQLCSDIRDRGKSQNNPALATLPHDDPVHVAPSLQGRRAQKM